MESWHTLDKDTARCKHCGGVSIWVPNYVRTVMGRSLKYWKWWRRFQQHHAHPEAGLDGPWFD